MTKRSAALEAADLIFIHGFDAMTEEEELALAARLRREDRERKAMERAILSWSHWSDGPNWMVKCGPAVKGLLEAAERIERRRARRGTK